jgi:hypothetical protein
MPLKDRRCEDNIKMILGRQAVRMGGGWTWQRIVPNTITVLISWIQEEESVS